MTPKEKANKLYRKFTKIFPSWIYVEQKWCSENDYSMHGNAKKAASGVTGRLYYALNFEA